MNKNYFYEPIKNNKYYVSENKYYNIIKKSSNGYKVMDQDNKTYFILKYGWQGYYYKDCSSFDSGKDVCYIPEFAYKDDNKSCIVVPFDRSNSSIYYRQDIIDTVYKELTSKAYKWMFKNKIPNKLITDLAEYVFDIVDWQHPESYLQETDWTEYIENYFDKNIDDKKKYASRKLQKQMIEEEGFSYE